MKRLSSILYNGLLNHRRLLQRCCILGVLVFSFSSHISQGVELVSQKDIEENKKKTKIFKLSNGIPVIHRLEESSDIINLTLSLDWALKDQKKGTKIIPTMLTSLLTRGSRRYPQKKIFSLIEKYSLGLGCSTGIDTSTCTFETINDYFEENISLLTSSLKEPEFDKKDFDNIRDKLISSKKSELEDPDQTVNQAVNQIYYDKAHPYLLTPEDAIKELESLSVKDIQSTHKAILNANRMSIAVVSSMDEAEIKRILEKEFGRLKGWKYKENTTSYPVSSKEVLSVIERDIPTSYIRVKIPAPALTDKEAATSQLLFEIISEEMAVEIRTKRSLSYAAYAYTGQGQIGLGVFGISTPKPEESLKVLADILSKMKTKEMNEGEFEEYKRTFSTGYFLGLETHQSLASTLIRSYYYTKGVDFVYEMPKRLGEVTPKDVQALAKKILKNYRVGVLGNKEQVSSKLGTMLM